MNLHDVLGTAENLRAADRPAAAVEGKLLSLLGLAAPAEDSNVHPFEARRSTRQVR